MRSSDVEGLPDYENMLKRLYTNTIKKYLNLLNLERPISSLTRKFMFYLTYK